MNNQVYDLLGVGIGPFNLSLAALLEPIADVNAVFLEQKSQFNWHSGLLLEAATIQVPFLADLVTMADPRSRFTFLNYLREHSRLYHFYFLEEFKIYRREYNHYCQWVSEQLGETCQFGQNVEAIAWNDSGYFTVMARDHGTGETVTYNAKHLALGVGSKAGIPECLRKLGKQDNIFHSGQFLHHKEQWQNAKSVTVIGSGQSAGETFYELLNAQADCGYHLEWHTRSAGFFPMEYSKLGLEYFSPDYIEYFYDLSIEKRDEIRSNQNLLYKGMDEGLIAEIYNRFYELTIGGTELDVKLCSSLEVKEAEITESGYRLSYRQVQQDHYFEHDTDCVVLATGYDHVVPEFIEPIRDLIKWDYKDRYCVNLDYRVTLTKSIPNSIFVQNGELHTHGIGAPDLGLGAHRSSVIINTFLEREVYPTAKKNVFQEFGVKSI
ncbi:L-lysine 6-monooxygenase (NADPH) [[Leptolyngbya] sp. PCC 7376]|uniref:L-lysine N6-monooxygenase MbtG n=1 Tax=[Leptolyngbya] sp. PCC 7376 TaxID=111781 RepID=K9Q544_9CHRO|nr:lysine N(6)-hydroxylase/L-ornithine N(5)-oxygenase family protein [[Leptolyngbya] sp. PCC 7376]AFY40276.1 L-lysine 6-monooxygenase (NADPH) [[Leptolyngbya] sp. PCC 7376]